jgi:hypothetical protein
MNDETDSELSLDQAAKRLVRERQREKEITTRIEARSNNATKSADGSPYIAGCSWILPHERTRSAHPPEPPFAGWSSFSTNIPIVGSAPKN